MWFPSLGLASPGGADSGGRREVWEASAGHGLAMALFLVARVRSNSASILELRWWSLSQNGYGAGGWWRCVKVALVATILLTLHCHAPVALCTHDLRQTEELKASHVWMTLSGDASNNGWLNER